MLNVSNSSVGSNSSFYAPISKRLKFLKHDTSICSETCDTTLERSLCCLNNTQVADQGGANNNPRHPREGAGHPQIDAQFHHMA